MSRIATNLILSACVVMGGLALTLSAPVNAGVQYTEAESTEAASTEQQYAQITWHEPENYTDVRPSYLDTGDQFQEIYFSRLERHIRRLSEMHFPEGYLLRLKVTDLDMGGEMQAGFGPDQQEQVRRRMPNDQPSMKFDFELLDEHGEVVKEGRNVEIEGRNIRTEGRSQFPNLSRRDRSLIGLEARMINRWFKETFLDD